MGARIRDKDERPKAAKPAAAVFAEEMLICECQQAKGRDGDSRGGSTAISGPHGI